MPIKYPSDLSDKYYLSIGFVEYSRPSPFQSLISLTPVAGAEQLCLPIPGNLVNSQDLNWGVGNGLLGNMLVDGVGAGFGDQTSQKDLAAAATVMGLTAIPWALGGLAGGAVSHALSSNPATSAGAGANGDNFGSMIQGGAQDVIKAVLQRVGLAVNPVLTMQFNAPEFKKHQFTWKFAPGKRTESTDLQTIVDQISLNALPDVAFGGAFFKYPSIANIRIHTGSKDLYAFQQSVITNVSVDYAPMKVPSFLVDQQPTEISLTISFVEIILNTRQNRAGGTVANFTSNPQGSLNWLNSSIKKVLGSF